MRIAVLAHYRHPIAEPYQGGLEMHTSLVVDDLVRRGHEVTLLARDGSETRARLVPLDLPDGVDRSEAVADLALVDGLQQVGGDIDVILNNSLSTVPYLHLDDHPVLTVLHTPATLERVVEVVAATDWRPGRQHVWAGVSQTTSRDWARWLPDVRWIPNGIDLHRWRPRPDVRRADRQAVWSGRITPEKGLAVAIDAAELAGWRLDISGPVADETYFRREIRPRLTQRIRYLGHLRHADLPPFLQSGSVFVFSPLWPEPFGLALVEALAGGTPAAALPHGAVAEIVGPTGGVIAGDGSAESLAVAMEAAARLDRGQVARSVARFDHTTMITAYERVLTELSLQSTDLDVDYV